MAVTSELIGLLVQNAICQLELRAYLLLGCSVRILYLNVFVMVLFAMHPCACF
jgi:hypothetical protein